MSNTIDRASRTVHTERDLAFSDPISHVEVMGLSSQIKLTRKAVVLLLDLRNLKSMMKREGKKEFNKYARSLM